MARIWKAAINVPYRTSVLDLYSIISMNTDPDPGFDERNGPNLNPDFDPDLEQGFSR